MYLRVRVVAKFYRNCLQGRSFSLPVLPLLLYTNGKIKIEALMGYSSTASFYQGYERPAMESM